MVAEGLSVEEAAECLELDVDACHLAIASTQGETIDCEDLIESKRADCIRAIIDIGLDTNENSSVRVAALKVIIEKKGQLPELAADKLDESFRRMKLVTERYDQELTTSKATNQQTTVIVENTNITKSNDFDSKFKAKLAEQQLEKAC